MDAFSTTEYIGLFVFVLVVVVAAFLLLRLSAALDAPAIEVGAPEGDVVSAEMTEAPRPKSSPSATRPGKRKHGR